MILSYIEQYNIVNDVYTRYKTKLDVYIGTHYSTLKSDYDYLCYGLCHEFDQELRKIYKYQRGKKLSDYIVVFKNKYAIKYGNGNDAVWWWDNERLRTGQQCLDDYITRLNFLKWMLKELKYRTHHPVKSYIERLLKINRY